MKNKSYQDIANEMVDVFKSNKSTEEQEIDFKNVVEKEEKYFLFSATIETVLNNICQLEPKETLDILNKFLVNSMMNGIISLGRNQKEFPINLKKEFAQNFKKNIENKGLTNGHMHYYGGQLSEIITLNKYYRDYHGLKDDTYREYYLKNFEVINEASKKFNKHLYLAGNESVMANFMIKGLYSIFNSRYEEEEKNKIFKERIEYCNSGLYSTIVKDGRLINDDIFKLDSPVFSSELSSFVKNIDNGEIFYNEIKLQLAKNNIKLNDVEVEKQELKDHTESIKSTLKSDNGLKK